MPSVADSVFGQSSDSIAPTSTEPEAGCGSPDSARGCLSDLSSCYPYFPEERWVTVAKYGGMGAGACLGWSTRFLLKQVFTVQLGVTGSLETRVVHGDLVANMLGAFVAGVLAHVKVHLEPWHPSVFWGLSIGFCGSCTTFSSWMAEAALQAWVPGPDGERRLEQLLRGAMLVLLGLLCLLEALGAGKRVGRFLDQRIKQQDKADGGGGFQLGRRPSTSSLATFDGTGKESQPLYMFVKSLVYWPSLLAMWLMVVGISSRTAVIEELGAMRAEDLDLHASERLSLDLLAGMCFAPLGAWARYELAKFNRHQRWVTFPFFTYVANMLGMAMSIACWALAMAFEPEEEKHHLLRSRTWIVAISGGLCGCLSTASTFASELATLADESKNGCFWYSFRYGAVSIVSAQVLACAVVVPYLALTEN